MQFAPQAFRSYALGQYVVVIDVVLHAPVGQRRDAAPAGDELEYGYGQLGGTPLQADARRTEHFADQVDPVFGHRIGNERFSRQVGGLDPPLRAQSMLHRQHGEDFKTEQRHGPELAAARLAGTDHQFRLSGPEQPDRIAVESSDEIDLDFRPAFAELVHDRHQPVEAGVAFEHDAQLSARVALHALDVPLRIHDRGQHVARELQQAQSRSGITQPAAGALEQRDSVMLFESPDLVRQRALGQTHPFRRAGQLAGLGNGDARSEVAQLDHKTFDMNFIQVRRKNYRLILTLPPPILHGLSKQNRNCHGYDPRSWLSAHRSAAGAPIL